MKNKTCFDKCVRDRRQCSDSDNVFVLVISIVHPCSISTSAISHSFCVVVHQRASTTRKCASRAWEIRFANMQAQHVSALEEKEGRLWSQDITIKRGASIILLITANFSQLVFLKDSEMRRRYQAAIGAASGWQCLLASWLKQFWACGHNCRSSASSSGN